MGTLKLRVVVLEVISITVIAVILGTLYGHTQVHALDGFMWPVYDHKVVQFYSDGHKALDIQSTAGNTGIDIFAAYDGVITFLGWDGYCDTNPPPASCPAYLSGGNMIKISHADGYETRYAHLDHFAEGLRVGQIVYKGEVIGVMGNTGHYNGEALSTHLHFEIRHNGSQVNPLSGYLTLEPEPIHSGLWSDVTLSPNPAAEGTSVTAEFDLGNYGDEGQPLLIKILFLRIRSPNGNAWEDLRTEMDPAGLIRKGKAWHFTFTATLPSNEPGNWIVESVELLDKHHGWQIVDLHGYSLPTLNVNSSKAKMIAGRTGRTINHEWHVVTFDKPLDDSSPILLADICSEYGVNAAHVDIKDVTSTSFTVRVEEDRGLDGIHTSEDICYIAIASSATYLPYRGEMSLSQVNPNVWTWQGYGTVYPAVRPMAVNIVSERGVNSTHADIDAYTDGIKIRLEEDLHDDGIHGSVEEVDWVVWSPSERPPGMDAGNWEHVNQNWTYISFHKTFHSLPIVIAKLTSENDGTCAMADIRRVSVSGFEARVEECLPSDGTHSQERISWMAVEPGVLE